MKVRFVIGALAILCVLSFILSGCSLNSESESIYSENSASYSSDIIVDSGNDSGGSTCSSDSSDVSDYGDFSIKEFSKIIDSKGIVLENTEQMRNLFLMSMDNDYLYFSSSSFPDTIWGFDRKDFSKKEVMTYNYDIEVGLGDNKYTYCGCFFTFPCYGEPYGGGVYMRALVGKVGEEKKCVLYKEVQMLNAYAAELNDTEMVFALFGGEDKAKIAYEIYKYKIGDEQAKLIYTKDGDFDGKMCCYNGEIYLFYKLKSTRHKPLFCLKRLNSDGEELEIEVFDLPEFSKSQVSEFTITENNYIIRFSTPETTERHLSAVIDRKSKKVALDCEIGFRLNDHIIDDRYIISYKLSDYGPQFCIFDDKQSEIHILTFESLKDAYIVNTAVDYNGDVLFQIQDDTKSENARSLVLFKDIISLI